MASPALAVAEFAEDTATPQEDVEEQEENDEQEQQQQQKQDVPREGETPEEALQRRIEEGNIGKGKTLRRWKDTEEKQRRVETGRHESKVQRYGQIYDEVKALRQETRHSVEDLRKRFKDSGVIQNKDQFIVRLIAQERNEQEGKVAAIKSLQQWRLTDVELHNFINRCHRRGIAGKLGLATQWAFEQEEAGGEVNFKEGLAFYSSIGILQPRSSAHTQQQWREWREWEDAMTSALENRKSRGSESAGEGAEPAGPDASCNEDSTVCNSPWSSERGGGGSFGGFSGNSLRASSTHGEGDVAGGNGSARSRARSGTAPETTKDGARLPRRGRAPAKRDSPVQKAEWWSWRSYSPPSMLMRRKSAETLRKPPADSSSSSGSGRKSSAAFGRSASGVTGGGGGTGSESGRGGGSKPYLLSLLGSDGHYDGGAAGSSSSQAGESVVRSSGGYLPPRHPLAALQMSPTSGRANGGPGSDAAGADGTASAGAESGESSGGEGAPVVGAVPGRPRIKARGQARTRAKGPAGGAPPRSPTARGALALEQEEGEDEEELGPAPTEGEACETGGKGGGGGGGGGGASSARRRRKAADDSGVRRRGRSPPRARSLSGVLSGLADWLMPGMESGPSRLIRVESGSELLMEVYPSEPKSPEKPGRPRSAPATPRGRRQTFSVLREGGWFYNGDSDYSTEEEDAGGDSDDEGFWADAGATELRQEVGDGGGLSVLKRLRKLFTGL